MRQSNRPKTGFSESLLQFVDELATLNVPVQLQRLLVIGLLSGCVPAEPDVCPTWFYDGDGDGAGRLSVSAQSCDQPENHVDNANDCDDTDPNRAAGNSCKNRGVWMWGEPNEEFGSVNVIGNPDKEAQVLNLFDRLGIRWVYQSTANLDQERVSAWNQELVSRDIMPIRLFGDNRWLCVSGLPEEALAENLFPFLENVDTTAWPLGVQLDIEPHAIRGEACDFNWGELSTGEQTSRLFDLADVYGVVRREIDEAGYSGLDVKAVIPAWYDSHLEGDGLFDSWSAQVADSVQGVHVMAFCQDNADDVIDASRNELLEFDDTRVAFDVSHLVGGNGECETWRDPAHMFNVAGEVEDRIADRGIDFQSLVHLMEAQD